MSERKVSAKGLTYKEIAGSQGFFVPIQYDETRMTGGLVKGQKYNLEIIEVEGNGSEDNRATDVSPD